MNVTCVAAYVCLSGPCLSLWDMAVFLWPFCIFWALSVTLGPVWPLSVSMGPVCLSGSVG